jgi:hypothetical protein
MPGKRRTALVLLLAFCCCFLLPVTVKADVVEVSAESYVLMDADSGLYDYQYCCPSGWHRRPDRHSYYAKNIWIPCLP